MALVYESYGRISAPILFHISANAVVYTCSKLGFFAGGTKTMFCMILMLGLSSALDLLVYQEGTTKSVDAYGKWYKKSQIPLYPVQLTPFCSMLK